MLVCRLKHYVMSPTNLSAFCFYFSAALRQLSEQSKDLHKDLVHQLYSVFLSSCRIGLMILKYSLLSLKTTCTLCSMHTHATAQGSGNNSHHTQCGELEPFPLLSQPGGVLPSFFCLQDISCFFSLLSIWVICCT